MGLWLGPGAADGADAVASPGAGGSAAAAGLQCSIGSLSFTSQSVMPF